MKDALSLITTGARFYAAADAQHRSIYQRNDRTMEEYKPAAGFEVSATQSLSQGRNKTMYQKFDRFLITRDITADLTVADNGDKSKMQMVFKITVSVRAIGNVLFALDLDLTCSRGALGKVMKLIPQSTETAVRVTSAMMVYIFDNGLPYDFDRSVRYWFVMAVKTLDPEIVFTFEIDTDPQIGAGARETIDINMILSLIHI